MENQTLKPIPHTVTKAQLQVMYNDLPTDYVKTTTIGVIDKLLQSNPHSKRSFRCKKLLHIEFVEIVDLLGVPKGYRLTPEFEASLQQLKITAHLHKIYECISLIRSQTREINNTSEKITIATSIAAKQQLHLPTILKILEL